MPLTRLNTNSSWAILYQILADIELEFPTLTWPE